VSLLSKVADGVFQEVPVVVTEQDSEQPHVERLPCPIGVGCASLPRVPGVVILGMHRSGTSAVAGFFARAGYYAGRQEDLLPPAEDNPTGFFEREDVNALNNELFASLGGAWDRPPAREAVEQAAPAWVGRARDIVKALEEGARGRPVVLKDPRISLALPVWRPALEGDFLWLVVDRSPPDTALSVRRRDGRPLYVALALWELYSTELVAGLARQRVLVTHYDNFVASPLEKGAALLKLAAAALPEGTAQILDAMAAKGFVSEGMRHHHTSLDSPFAAEVLTVRQMSLARWLAGLPEGWAALEPPASLVAQPQAALVAAAEYYDAMGDRYGMEKAYDAERHRALHFEQATELKDRHIANIEAALEAATKRADSAEEHASLLEAEVAKLKAENSRLRAELERLRRDGVAAASNLLTIAKARLAGGRLVGTGAGDQEIWGSARG
jgi:cytochrome c556